MSIANKNHILTSVPIVVRKAARDARVTARSEVPGGNYGSLPRSVNSIQSGGFLCTTVTATVGTFLRTIASWPHEWVIPNQILDRGSVCMCIWPPVSHLFVMPLVGLSRLHRVYQILYDIFTKNSTCNYYYLFSLTWPLGPVSLVIVMSVYAWIYIYIPSPLCSWLDPVIVPAFCYRSSTHGALKSWSCSVLDSWIITAWSL